MMVNIFLFLVAVAASWQSLVCLNKAHWSHAAVAHLACAVIALLINSRTGEKRKGGIFEIAVAFCMPCIGGAVASLYGVCGKLGNSEHIAEEFNHYINASERLGMNPVGDHGPEAINPGNLESLSDILRSDVADDEKRLAIALLAQLETPQAIDILRGALASDSAEVRFYAASVINRLEERLAMRLSSIEENMRKNRRGARASNMDLARAYLDYAYYNLAQDERREACLQEAMDNAMLASQTTGSAEPFLLAGRAAMLMKKYAMAEDLFTRYLDLQGHDMKGYMWRAEARFYLGRYGFVRDDCALASDHGKIPRRMSDAVEVWI